MFNFRKFFLYFFILICLNEAAQAQYIIKSIDIQGNTKTKSYILLRELPFHIGDILSKDSLEVLNTLAEQQLYNTSLFLSTKVTPLFLQGNESGHVHIQIVVKERWYTLPKPYFKWIDRNFSQWWNEQHHSLDHVNYGVSLFQSNLTGNNDKLVVGVIGGYTKQNILRYQLPFFDKKLKYGFGLGWQDYTQKEMNYTTQNDKQVFFKTLEVIRSGYRANASVTYRPNLFERHALQIGWGNEQLSDSGFMKQPLFLPNHKKALSYMDLSVAFTKVQFDYNAYPTKGNSTELIAYQRFSTASNFTSIQFRKIKAHSFSPQNFILLESNSMLKLLPNYNYLDARLVGYGNMQFNGLEYYIIDGNAATIFKTSFQHSIGHITIKNPITQKFLPEAKFQFWVRAFSNLGYVYSDHVLNTNKLSNTLIRTAGIGLDVISIYDFVLKIDYSVNQLGDKGLYLHGGINF